jgi:hypothetical protein
MLKLIIKSSCSTYLLLLIFINGWEFLTPPHAVTVHSIAKSLLGIPFFFFLGAVFFIPSVWKIVKDIFLNPAIEKSAFLQSIPGGPIVALLLLFIIILATYLTFRYVKKRTESFYSVISLVALEIIWFFIFIMSFPIMEISA